MNDKMILKIKADHVSVISTGSADVLVIINPIEVSPVRIGKRFNRVELHDHKTQHEYKDGLFLVTQNQVHSTYAKDDVVNQVRHITLSVL